MGDSATNTPASVTTGTNTEIQSSATNSTGTITNNKVAASSSSGAAAPSTNPLRRTLIKRSRCLYVGRLPRDSLGVVEALKRDFSKYGALEDVVFNQSKNCLWI